MHAGTSGGISSPWHVLCTTRRIRSMGISDSPAPPFCRFVNISSKPHRRKLRCVFRKPYWLFHTHTLTHTLTFVGTAEDAASDSEVQGWGCRQFVTRCRGAVELEHGQGSQQAMGCRSGHLDPFVFSGARDREGACL